MNEKQKHKRKEKKKTQRKKRRKEKKYVQKINENASSLRTVNQKQKIKKKYNK